MKAKNTYEIIWLDTEYNVRLVRANTAQEAVNIALERLPETVKIITVDKIEREHCWDWKDPRK